MRKTFYSLASGLALLLLAVIFVGSSTGCAHRTLEAASTKLLVSTPGGKTVEFAFPKELNAQMLDLSVDPTTGIITLKADSLKSSSQGLIESASAAQAEAISKLSGTVEKLLPLVLPAK